MLHNKSFIDKACLVNLVITANILVFYFMSRYDIIQGDHRVTVEH